MAGPREYTRATLLALVSLGRASCYWPDPPCEEPVVVLVKGEPVTNLEIAHIHAARSDGPRFRPDMTDDQRRDFKNVMLLCTPHHRFVDIIKPLNYPAEVLFQWKAEKEKGGIQALSGLTDENLGEHVIGAMQQATAELNQALGQLRELSPVAADLLKAANASELLFSASTRLSGLLTAAELLHDAAYRLPPNLADIADQLSAASYRLGPQ